MKYLITVLFSFSFFISNAQFQCAGVEYPVEKFVFTDLIKTYDQLDIAMVAEGEKIRNVCGSKYGYRLLFDVEDYFLNNSTVNLTITLVSNHINPIVESYDNIFSGLTQNGNTITFDIVLNNSNQTCGSILFSIPEVNSVDAEQVGDGYFLRKYIGFQGFDLTLMNNMNNTTITDYINTFNVNWFEYYFHKFSDFNFHDLTMSDYIDKSLLAFHTKGIVDIPFHLDNANAGSDRKKMFFYQDATLDVPKNSSLWVTGYELTTCEESIEWDGIQLEEEQQFDNVYSLILDNVDGNNASTLVTSRDHAQLSIDNCIFRDSDRGMLLHNNQDIQFFQGNTFTNLDRGVELLHADNVELNGTLTQPNSFVNCNKNGIYAYNSDNVEVMNNIFDNCGNAGYNFSSNGSLYGYSSNVLIANNEFKNSAKGIVMTSSDATIIKNNTFEDHFLAGKFNRNNDLLYIADNEVNSGKSGFYFRNNLNPQVFDNFIVHSTNIANEDNYGVRFDFGGYGVASRNTFNSSKATAGTVFNNTNGGFAFSNVHNIQVRDLTAGIRIDAADGVVLENNLVNAAGTDGLQSFGIVSSMGSMANLNCNDLFNLEEGLVMKDNTMSFDIFSNYMSDLAAGIDLIHSQIGTQSHRGNQFYGPFSSADINAQEMSDDDISLSNFEIDQTDGAEFWPDIVLLPPGGSNDLVYNIQGVTQTCSGPLPPTTNTDRLLSLCERIRAIQNNPNINPIRKANILAHYFRLIKKYFPNQEDWPSCIQTFMNGLVNTNVEKMSEVQILRDSLFSYTQVQNNISMSDMEGALDGYLQAISTNTNVESTQSAYWDEVNAVSSLYNGLDIRNESILAEIESIMSNFSPTNAYEDAWEVAMNGWIKDYKGEEFNTIEQSELEDVAALCPLLYGGAVHSARAIISEWNPQRFDTDNDCEEVYIRSNLSNGINKIDISPNPTTGMVYIHTTEQSSVAVYNALGIQLMNKQMETSMLDLSPLRDGVYLIKVTSGDITLTKQIIKLQ